MATFIWDPAVRWPPPANILLNYDVVGPGGVVLSSQASKTTPGEDAMTKVIIVGEIYNAGLEVGGGPIAPGAPGQPPGYWGGVAPPYPDHGLPGQPPGYWGGVAPPWVSHPIAPGGRPPGIWGGAPPYVDIGGPGSQPHPSHPIAPGGRPPGYWGGIAPPYPDQGLPGQPPGYWGGVAPPTPTHPIAPGGPGQPPGYWGGGNVPMPGNPMVPPTEAVWVIGYTPGYGPTWVQVKPIAPAEPTEPETEPEPTPQA
jgi:hypothetical protein